MKWMLLSLISLGMFSGCGAVVSRPDADICGINYAPDKPAHLSCYNIRDDFNDDGTLKSTAHAHSKPILKPQSLNAGTYVSKEDWPKFQVWLQDSRDWVTNHCR